MLVSDFHYELPAESIAQEPLADRTGSRLLHLIRPDQNRQLEFDQTASRQKWEDLTFREFPDLLRASDLLVVNNTRVFPARLYGRRSGRRAQPLSPHNPAAGDFLHGRVEVLLTRQVADDPNEWECLVRPGRKIGVGEKLYFSRVENAPRNETPEGGRAEVEGHREAPPPELEAEVTQRGGFGERRIRFAPVSDLFARIERIGHVPLPPYIDRYDLATDRERYQTVYAQTAEGMARSVAAPTAGLHFTPEILAKIRGRGVEIAEITLHVGLGTFQPVRIEKVEDHKLHREWFEISAEAARAVSRAKAENRRVVAVGTTTVRTLEYAAGLASQRGDEGRVEARRGEADIFIYPGYRFRIVDALLTNFHLPQSTLLMLVCAFGGKELVMDAYRHAIGAGYRFYSYGDCMFLE
ncbi:MAG TPA: tRNA preQ1(34) S-adenosylmethionine ribosyltransferase-isomerase QueA [Terriglobales bacterium]|jgi:S-adenosylmethionine:tRNA ribosyltransferase-isomerase|nr:tRNA preQ1(34) S-adenosylmethionine ribosyltransferase-isomerase QueA [Terriglobales bacterium]